MESHINKRNKAFSERRSIKIALAITAVMAVVEVIGGILANSIALIGDAGHMLTDTIAILLSYIAMFIASKPPTSRKTFGFHRFEILAAFINGTTLVIVAVYLFYESFRRFFNPPEVDGAVMFAVAILGLIANIVGVYFLRKVEKSNLNIRSAFLHMLGDLLSSFGVVGGGIVMYFTGWNSIDPVIGILIGGIILRGAANLVMESGNILLEAAPGHISLEDVEMGICSVNGVIGVHDLHIWTITSGMHALSAHVMIDDKRISEGVRVIQEINQILKENFDVSHSTIQMESGNCSESAVNGT
ncbi:MAG TPA: cation diffusion facilitator family transporter [bacterium]